MVMMGSTNLATGFPIIDKEKFSFVQVWWWSFQDVMVCILLEVTNGSSFYCIGKLWTVMSFMLWAIWETWRLSTHSIWFYSDAWDQYLNFGLGNEILAVLQDKFNAMTFKHIYHVQQDTLNITLADSQDLDSFMNAFHDQSKLLKEVGQGFSDSQLVYMTMHQLEKSWYKTQIKAMQVAYSIDATAYSTLASLVHTLQHRDIFDGKFFGGAPLISPTRTSGIIKSSYSGSGLSKKVRFGQASLGCRCSWRFIYFHSRKESLGQRCWVDSRSDSILEEIIQVCSMLLQWTLNFLHS